MIFVFFYNNMMMYIKIDFIYIFMFPLAMTNLQYNMDHC
jgi:hypothetical protein